MRTIIAVVGALALAGCYSSSITGDVQTDLGTDATHDTSVDTPLDTTVDTVHDTVVDLPTDVPADVPCIPASGVTAGFTIDGFPEYEDVDVMLGCEAIGWGEDVDGTAWALMLGCFTDEGIAGEYTITLASSPYLMYPSPPGTGLLLRYVNQPMWPGSRWFTLMTEGGGLVAAGTEAWTPAPPGWDMAEWYAPIRFGVRTGICSIDETDCGPFERLGIEIDLDCYGAVIPDGNRGEVGSLMGPTALVNVQAAWQYLELWCDGAPATWYQLALVVPPSM